MSPDPISAKLLAVATSLDYLLYTDRPAVIPDAVFDVVFAAGGA